jgi:hypothetical protein
MEQVYVKPTEIKSLENYPFRIVLISNLVSLTLYGLGFFIMLHWTWYAAIAYLLYIFAFELRLIRNHCTDCYYWGKVCGFGKGKISALFFKKGDTSKFCGVKMTWKDIVPDFLIALIPFIVGIILIIIDFNFFLIAAIAGILLLTTLGNSMVRGKLVCNHCKQREIGCPAEKFFNKDK